MNVLCKGVISVPLFISVKIKFYTSDASHSCREDA